MSDMQIGDASPQETNCIIDDSMQKDQILYQNMLDLLQRVWVRFTSKEPSEWKAPLSMNANKQREGTNLRALYVAESIMSHGQRTYSALSDLEYRRDRVPEENKRKAI
uniref:Uncharacterized protein n=2 Tax=Leersia perrieri TaxID=77586 RepID=A0A0D9VUZ8_9ORYZ